MLLLLSLGLPPTQICGYAPGGKWLCSPNVGAASTGLTDVAASVTAKMDPVSTLIARDLGLIV
jgi:hypothetical protein